MKISDKQFLFDTFQKEEKKSRKCMYPGCSNNAINSHVFQQKGILSDISVDGHLIVLEPPDIWKINFESDDIPDSSLHVRKRGIKNAYCFPGFCDIHDTEVFLPIEQNIQEVNFLNYSNQLLFSYRGLCNEIHRKTVAYAYQDRVFNKLLDEDNFDGADYLSYSKDGMKSGIENLEKFKLTLEEDLFGNSSQKQFEFKVFEFERFDVGISVVLNILPRDFSMEDGNVDYVAGNKVSSQFINIFPLDNKSIVIIGQEVDLPSDYFAFLVSEFENCSDFNDYKRILSDLITARLEFWCMNPDLFKSLDKKKLNAYLKFFTENINSHEFDLHSGINIFD